MGENQKLLRRPEVAERFGIPLSTLEKLRDIPVIKLGASVYYDPADVWAWLQAKKVRPSPRAAGAAV